MARKYDLQVQGNLLLWYNGDRWLVKETCATPEAATQLYNQLNVVN